MSLLLDESTQTLSDLIRWLLKYQPWHCLTWFIYYPSLSPTWFIEFAEFSYQVKLWLNWYFTVSNLLNFLLTILMLFALLNLLLLYVWIYLDSVVRAQKRIDSIWKLFLDVNRDKLDSKVQSCRSSGAVLDSSVKRFKVRPESPSLIEFGPVAVNLFSMQWFVKYDVMGASIAVPLNQRVVLRLGIMWWYYF